MNRKGIRFTIQITCKQGLTKIGEVILMPNIKSKRQRERERVGGGGVTLAALKACSDLVRVKAFFFSSTDTVVIILTHRLEDRDGDGDGDEVNLGL